MSGTGCLRPFWPELGPPERRTLPSRTPPAVPGAHAPPFPCPRRLESAAGNPTTSDPYADRASARARREAREARLASLASRVEEDSSRDYRKVGACPPCRRPHPQPPGRPRGLRKRRSGDRVAPCCSTLVCGSRAVSTCQGHALTGAGRGGPETKGRRSETACPSPAGLPCGDSHEALRVLGTVCGMQGAPSVALERPQFWASRQPALSSARDAATR